jgi:NitT/TauT family transport system permease protein
VSDAQTIERPRAEPITRPTAPRLAAVARSIAPPLLLLAVVLGGWQLMAWRFDDPLVPTVGAVAERLGEITRGPTFWEDLTITVARVLTGFAVAFPLAVAAGIAMGRSNAVRRALEPAIILGLTIPSLVWALLGVIWFGIGFVNPVLVVTLTAVSPLTLNILQGVRAVDADLLEMAHVYRFSRRRRLVSIWIPALVPNLLAGARLGLSMAWKVIVLVEIFGMSSGVGYQINNEFGNHDVAGVLAWTIVFGAVMAVLEYGVLRTLEARFGRWRKVAIV